MSFQLQLIMVNNNTSTKINIDLVDIKNENINKIFKLILENKYFTYTNLLDIHRFFGIEEEQLKKIIFIYGGKNVSKNKKSENLEETKYQLHDNHNLIIFVKKKDMELLGKKMEMLYKKNGKIINDQNKTKNENVKLDEEKLIISFKDYEKENGNESNETNLNILKNKEFLYLLKIVVTKPEYLNYVYNLISHGSIEELKKENIEELDFTNFEFNNELSELNGILNSIELQCDEKYKKHLLNKLKGNVFLASAEAISAKVNA